MVKEPGPVHEQDSEGDLLTKSDVLAFVHQTGAETRQRYEGMFETRLAEPQLKYEKAMERQKLEIAELKSKLAAVPEEFMQSKRPTSEETNMLQSHVRIKGLQ